MSDKILLCNAVEDRDISAISRLLEISDVKISDLDALVWLAIVRGYGDVLRALLVTKVGRFSAPAVSTYSTTRLLYDSNFSCLLELRRRGVGEAAAHVKKHTDVYIIIDLSISLRSICCHFYSTTTLGPFACK